MVSNPQIRRNKLIDHVKVVLVGCGGISHAWLSAAKKVDGLEIVGLVDLLPENAHKRAVEFALNHVKVSDDLTAVLHETKPDAVFDCTVPDAHTATTLEALKYGCHVLGEKPMANSYENACRMVDAALARGKIYAVIQNYRYNADIRNLKQAIDSDDIGPLTTLNSDFFIGAHFGGFRDVMPHVLLQDMAIHTFDAARFISGADPLSVYCTEVNPEGSWFAHGASAFAIFEMTHQITFSYRGSWCSEGMLTSWNSEWRMIGQKGTIKWDGAHEIKGEVVQAAGGFHSQYKPIQIPDGANPQKTASHLSIIREFTDAIRKGGVPETICTDNIKSLAMVFSAIKSAETGKKVDITF